MVDQIKFDNEQKLNRAMELLHFGYRAFTAEADHILSQQRLSRVHHRILYFVARDPGLAVGALLEILAVSKQALHGPLRDLLQAELVISTPLPADKRSRSLQLSKKGSALEQEVTQTQHRLLEEVLGSDDGESAAWHTVMARLAKRETDRPLD